jgi:hypothetical protein
MSAAEVRERMVSKPTFYLKIAYITSQLAFITCKKDRHEILSGYVSKRISAAYEKLLSSALVFIRVPYEKKVQSIYLSRHAKDLAV